MLWFHFKILGIENSYYLVDPSNYEVIPNNNYNDSGSLYYCKGETVTCTEQLNIGYYVVDKETIYTCEDKGNGLTCKRNRLTYDASKICKNKPENVGKLFLASEDTTDISICLNGDNDDEGSVVLNTSNSGDYLISKNSDPSINVFGITGSNEKYAIININDKVVTLKSNYKNNLKYVYVNDKTNKIMEKGDKTYPIVEGSTTGEIDKDKIKELLCTGGKCKDSSTEVKLTSDSITGAGKYLNFFLFYINLYKETKIIIFYNN